MLPIPGLFHVAILVVFTNGGQPAMDRLVSERTWNTLAACKAELPAMKEDFGAHLAMKVAQAKAPSLRVGFKAECEPVNAGKIGETGIRKDPNGRDI
jgi:hypothetical protein